MAEFTDEGVIVESFADIQTRIETRYREAFGSDIQVGAGSKYGSQILITTEIISEFNLQVSDTATVFDPDQATKAILSRQVQLNGIEREDPEFSTDGCAVTGVDGTVIAVGDIVRAPGGTVDWEMVTEITISGGVGTGTIRSTVTGAIDSGAPGTITEIANAILGWTTVTNDGNTILGRVQETDPELRVRRTIVAKSGGGGSVDRIASRLFELVDVVDVKVIENTTGALLPPDNQPDSTVRAIVLGGTDEDIASVLMRNKAGGMPTFAVDATLHPYVSPITGQTYNVKFDRPTQIPIFITIDITTNAAFPNNGLTQIKQAIVDWFNGTFSINGLVIPGKLIGDDIENSRLYSPVNSVPGHTINTLFADTSASPVVSTDIPISVTQLATLDIANIIVTT